MTGQAKVQLILELKNRLNTGLSEAKKRLNGTVEGMKDKLNSLKLSHTKAFSAMTDQIPGFGNAMAALGNPYVLVTAGLLALTAAGVKASKWSNEWATNMAKANVTAQLAPPQLQQLSDQLVKIGTRNVGPLEQVPEAFNRIISAGLDVNTSLAVLEPTLRASKAGFADLETVAAAGVGVMASSGENINRVYDILFATLNKGNAEFKDIAQYLPKIVPLARGAGFALDETAAAWAFLTAQGQKAEQATTGIMNMVKAFSNVDTIKGLKGAGIDVFDAKGKVKPILDIVTMLQSKMGKLSDKGKANFLDAIGLKDMEAKGAILAMVQDVTKLKGITDATVLSQGALNTAYENARAPLDDWAIIMNSIKGNFIKPFGDFFLNVFSKLGTWILNASKATKEWYRNSMLLQDALSGIGFVLKWVIVKPLEGLWWVIKKLWQGLSWVLGQIGNGFEWLYRTIKPVFIWLDEALMSIWNIIKAIFTGDFSGAWKAIKNFHVPSISDIRKRMESDFEAKNKAQKNENNPFSTETKIPSLEDPDKSNNGLGDGGISKITDSGQAPRNITINIDSFIKGGLNVSNTNMQNMSLRQIEETVKDMFLRVIANVETGYQ
ncbi:phage tail tape measure protein [Acetobacteroides hydrogenigenes]|uniref:TP901 family phage tail tape measure protein n=1 Tax=Acetobacteroides hydrogenigenes TaxID=979970 RepID=A0A4R2E6L4_9BACT|nr:phage tail tape measure protein [Acetobacteroides hydrogenigenes]TCN63693.1 TP901 family phage tail tape measure protein [Acetobacteroides hydrogenigenes]